MAERPINLGWMRILLEIGKRGSLTAAAQELGLTQPAVSYQIRRLEEELGIRVLKRQHRGVELTPEGRRLYDTVSRHVAEIDLLAGEFKTNERPTVRLHTDYAFSSLWLLPRMQEFRARYPDINIQIAATQNPLRQSAGENDVLVIFGSREEAGNNATLLLPEKVRPVCAPGFLESAAEMATPEHFAKLKLIHLESSWASTWHDWPSYLASLGVNRSPEYGRGDISFNTYSLVVQSAIGHQGLALGWAGLVDDLLESGALVSVGPELEAKDRGYWLMGSSVRKGATAKLVDWLLEQAP
ncbi:MULTISPECIES: choline sulfate utilization transcriptional regulator [Agrobacterium]|uniref:HTH-type transcriptional regulator TtuA n=1 Tax=Agrobacterium rosae TaxID=1972867 RepID=A0A1R3TND0_9HYPH|nr:MULTISPECIES: LysR substrate-binding domain-containing protein [Agrobacterium]KAA3511585.1 LysR family transcriptional regulator [Agrobacterium rosae]KAA3518991.1 LysR family transcriptional regulator [Agrobacterium rosae]MCM2435202.1 LysR family transcriptional regulator [Agrobacterium rosae]MDX8314160.1 LysR substrate-binding domain-containing protein [Agrobacterium rosae]MDX8331063.1 LysR substrate-binding domain-containing protein [Agrobacterium rosae]